MHKSSEFSEFKETTVVNELYQEEIFFGFEKE